MPPPRPASPHPTPSVRIDEHHSLGAERTRALLALGTDSNERLHVGSIDWTPLALAVAVRGADLVEMLVNYGADVNARWCMPVYFGRDAVPSAPAGCTKETGMTALMFAAMRGDQEIV